MAEKRIAVTLPASPRVQDTIERAKWAEDNGYTDAWFADGNSPDSMTTAAALAAHTSTIRIGVAVTPVFTRAPSVLAATANALGQLLPGRFIMGLGSSSQTMMVNWNGVHFEKPLTRVKETCELVRIMLAGEKTDYQGETVFSRGYRQAPMDNPPPIYLAALRSKMIEMAAETGDGVIFNLWPKDALPKMIEHKAIGARRAGKDPDAVEVVNRFMVCVTDDKPAARDLFRASFGPYYATPVYNKFLEWSGYADAAAQIREGWAAKDRGKVAGAMTDELVDAIGVIGTEDECRERIQWAHDAGVDTAIIAPLGPDAAAVQRTLACFTR